VKTEISSDRPLAVKECSRCASHVEWRDGTPAGSAYRFRALREAEVHLLRGAIIGLCSHGRNHLIVDARRDRAVAQIRELAGSKTGALPMMFQTVEAAAVFFDIPTRSRNALSDPESEPVILSRKRTWRDLAVSGEVNPAGAEKVPVMVSKTSLHFLLLGRIESPVVAIEVESFTELALPGGNVPVLVLDCPAYRWVRERHGTKYVCVRGRVEDPDC
jgi:hydrogenase maturation factor HypF (carbamoyltransferase family)